MMTDAFFPDNVLLRTPRAEALYEQVKDLPIVDYHSHLSEEDIARNRRFTSLGELWLGCDHYKWRAMRACGVPERLITGDGSDEEKFLAYAAILPKLCGNPLYLWSHMELKALFGIEGPLNAETAPGIYARAGEVLRDLPAREILKRFRVEYVATTDDPVSPLSAHGDYEGIAVRPTFRPDRALHPDAAYLARLAEACGHPVATLEDWKRAMEERLLFFRTKGCVIADVSMETVPDPDVTEEEAAAIFRSGLEGEREKRRFCSYGLRFLGRLFAGQNIVWQLHIGAFRNINGGAFSRLGADSGYDVMHGCVDTDGVARFLNALAEEGSLPKVVLYSLNPGAVPALCTVAGSFPDVRMGAAWWFNDTLRGIRTHLSVLSEYGALGTSLGMLTDSRSLSSYCRFDFFRRVLCDLVAEAVDGGEYDAEAALPLLRDICYHNPKRFLGI